MRLYTAEEMSRADARAQELGIPGGVLMERAGAEMARVALEAFAPRHALVVAGGGNNGGDGFVIARELHRAGAEVAVLPTKDEYEGDPRTNLEALRSLGVRFVSVEELEAELGLADLVVDALLGTGFSGEVRDREARLIEEINGSAAPVLAVDVPSGVDGATGEVRGAAVRADLTVCAHVVKVGCVVSPGREHAGEVGAVEIGIPPEADVESSLVWTDAGSLRGTIPRTTEPAHKYSADALLGTGFSGEVRDREARLIEGINGSAAPVLAVDVPSGVDGATGEVRGAAVRADLTVCAHVVKVGCVVSPGREHAGEVGAVEIGIPPEADVESSLVWTDAGSLRGTIPRTTEPAHKYSAGALLVVAGSRGTTGAPQMVVRGAERTGCGIAFLATAEGSATSVDLELTEALVHGVPETEEGYLSSAALEKILELSERTSALVVGPGMGVGDEGRRLVEGILQEIEVPVLLDADAVTNLAGSDALAGRRAPTVITPHAGELGRLLGSGAKEVGARRLRAAREAAETHGCCVLLKGSDTLVARGASVAVNSTGNVALATAGTGDVLSGVIGALLSRGMDAYEAARAGAWVHGRAAELWLEETGWPAESMIATDLLDYLPEAVGELL